MLSRYRFGLLVVVTFVGLPGCDQQQVQDAVSTGVGQARQAVNRTVETVKQEASLVGSMKIAVDPPLAAKACYASLVVLDDRPNILKLASCQDETLERFPSIYVHAQVDTATLTELVGESTPARIFAQASPDGPLWHTADDAPAELRITAVDGQALRAEVTGATLLNTDGSQAKDISGTFVALLN